MPLLMAAPSEIDRAVRLALRGRTRPRPFEPEGPDRVSPIKGRGRKPHTDCSAHDQRLTHGETLLANHLVEVDSSKARWQSCARAGPEYPCHSAGRCARSDTHSPSGTERRRSRQPAPALRWRRRPLRSRPSSPSDCTFSCTSPKCSMEFYLAVSATERRNEIVVYMSCDHIFRTFGRRIRQTAKHDSDHGTGYDPDQYVTAPGHVSLCCGHGDKGGIIRMRSLA